MIFTGKIASLAVISVLLSGCACDFNWDRDVAGLKPAHRTTHRLEHSAFAAGLRARIAARIAAHVADERRHIEDTCASIHDLWLAHRTLTVTDQSFSGEHCPQAKN